jgi:hypothetical protein
MKLRSLKDEGELLRCVRAEERSVVEAMEHLADHFHLLEEEFEGARLRLCGISLTADLRVEGKGLLQGVADTDIVDYEAARLIPEDYGSPVRWPA